ncbi:MAG: hypothetical protein QOI57_2468 [Rubrobacteraceae bacterium]|nr:hypothetical protein [Rubrobacteraceae bacterium]
MRPTPPLVFNTFSIVAHDPASGMFGVGASTRLPAVGALVPYARCGVGAIATQARTNPLLGYDGLDLLQQGYDAGETLKILLGSDPEPEKRQVGIVDSWGRSAAHTGSEADPWRGHLVGDGYAVMGNLVVGEEVIVAMAEAFEASVDEPLPERLMRALEAGHAVGGDKRGKQSAAIYAVKDQPYPYIDLRVDEHTDPVVELRRIYEVVKVQMLPFIEALPTRRNPKGDFGEEIRGILIPNGGSPQANGKVPEGMPLPQSLQSTLQDP